MFHLEFRILTANVSVFGEGLSLIGNVDVDCGMLLENVGV